MLVQHRLIATKKLVITDVGIWLLPWPQKLSRAHGVVVSHPLRMRKALGSNPSVSILLQAVAVTGRVIETIFSRVAEITYNLSSKSQKLQCAQVQQNAEELSMSLSDGMGQEGLSTDIQNHRRLTQRGRGLQFAAIVSDGHGVHTCRAKRKVHRRAQAQISTRARTNLSVGHTRRPSLRVDLRSRRRHHENTIASAGNRARVTSMATMYSTTRPLMPCSEGCLSL